MCAMAAVAGAATRGARESSAAARLHSALLALGRPSDSCTTQCEYTSCDDPKHKNATHSSATNGGTTHNCEFSEGGCTDHRCNVEFDNAHVDLTAVETMLREVSGAELKSLSRINSRLIINRDRGAAQIVSCGQRIAVSVQLSKEQILAL
jgi:hypothetical protein